MAYSAPAFVDPIQPDPDFATPPLTGNLDTVKLANGGFALIGDVDGHISGSIYNSQGVRVVASIADIAGTNGGVAQLTNGNLVISSQDAEGARYTIVSSTTGAIISSAIFAPGGVNTDVSALPGGGFAVAFQYNYDSPADSDVGVVIINSAGSEIRNLFPDATTALDTDISVAGLDNGNVAMSWTRTDGSGNTKIFYAVYNSDGDEVQAQTQISTNDPLINRNSHIEAVNGGFAIAYERRTAPDFTIPSTVDIWVSTFELTGAPITDHVITNRGLFLGADDDGSNDHDPHISRSPDGNLLVTYTRQDNTTAFTVIKGGEYIDGTISGAGTGSAGVVFDVGRFGIFQAGPGAAGGQHFTGNTDGTGGEGGDLGLGDDFKDTMNGGGGDDTLYGGANNDELKGDDGNDELHGGIGNDVMSGAGDTGDDFSNDTLYGELGNDLMSGAGGADTLYGGEGNDRLFGTGGIEPETSEDNAADRLDGGAGTDTMAGGGGNDTYVNPTGDVITELANGGTDTVESNVTFTLSGRQQVENLTLTGTAANATGNGYNNVLRGNASANRLDGGLGNDTLIGGAGNDTYINPTGDTITELAGGGTDTVESNVTFTLSGRQQVENLVLTGNANIDGTGNSYANLITESFGVNTLRGGEGNDTIIGGNADTVFGDGGDDTIIDVFTNVGTKDGGSGNDLLDLSSPGNPFDVDLTYDLSAPSFSAYGNTYVGFESLIATNRKDTIIGTAGANYLNGFTDNDTLNGGGGTDTLVGGAGNDTFINPAGDTIIEQANGGTDTVQSSVTFSLNGIQQVENLTLTGTAANATGNSYNNVLTGNAGNNVLNGLTGADTMTGGAGNDTYHVDAGADQTIEATNGGTADLVISAISRTLSDHVENLTLGGTGNIDGNGNALANVITGNAGNNTMRGYDGADTISSGEGQDLLIGGLGSDSLNPGSDAVRDVIRVSSATESTGAQRDIVTGMDLTNEDDFDFTAIPTSIVFVGSGALNLANFDANLAAAVNAGLAVNGCVLFDPNAGDLNVAGHLFVIVDGNGDGSYTANQDYVVELVNSTGFLSLDDFV